VYRALAGLVISLGSNFSKANGGAMTSYVYTFKIGVDELAAIYKYAATVDKSEVVWLGFVLCTILNGYDRLSGSYTFSLDDLRVDTLEMALGKDVWKMIDKSELASTSTFGGRPTEAEIEELLRHRKNEE
jgi:hypothetical protein